jgi:type I restriction enzyme S subunit
VTADLLIRNFEALAAAPGGVPKLRELILSLAVRGELVPQDSGQRCPLRTDIPAKDYPFNLPRNWSWCAFGSVTVNRDGERIPVSRDERSHRRGPFDYYGASGVIDTIDGYLFDKPLLLIGEDGANLINRTTPIAFIARGKYWVNNHAHVVDVAPGLSLEYLALFVNAISLEAYITGTAQPKMNQAKMNSIPVAVPPLPEQHRIVAKVDELMALCDELEARQEEARTTQAALTRSALHHLTAATDPAECSKRWTFVRDNFQALEARPESVTELRKAILQLAVEGRLVPGDGAEHWPTRRFHTVAKISGGVTKGRRLIGRRLIELPYLRVANVQRGFLNLEVVKTIAIASDELDRYRLLPEDVLVVEGGDWDKVGRAAIWRGEIDVCLHQNHIFRARVDRAVVRPEWVQLALNSSGGRAYFEGASKQTTNLASINMTQLRGFPVPLPSVQDQIKTLVSVEALLKLCDELEAGLKRERADADRLFDAVVAGLMEGAA